MLIFQGVSENIHHKKKMFCHTCRLSWLKTWMLTNIKEISTHTHMRRMGLTYLPPFTINLSHVGKYSSPMEHVGYMNAITVKSL